MATVRGSGQSPHARLFDRLNQHQGNVGVGARPAHRPRPLPDPLVPQHRFHPPRVAKPRHNDFLVILFPPGGLSSPYGRPTDPHKGPDLDGVSAFRTHELRPGWAYPLPRGPRCSSDRSRSPASARRILSGQSLHPATTIHLCGALLDEASTRGSHEFARPDFPSPDAPGWNESDFGFSRASHPAIATGCGRARSRSAPRLRDRA